MVLYPPLINPSIPAFLLSDDNTIKELVVFFSHNRAVDANNVKEMQILMWAQGDVDKKTRTFITEDVDFKTGRAIFHNLEPNKGIENEEDFMPLQQGLYYKVQLAYVGYEEKKEIAYSTVGVTKCLGLETNLTFELYDCYHEEALNPLNIHPNLYNYEIKFKVDGLISEKVYQYRFSLKDNEQQLIDGGKWCFLNEDGKMYFSLTEPLQNYLIYKLDIEIKTSNNLSLLNTYKIVKDLEFPNLYKGDIVAFQDEEALDNGFVYIQLKPYTDAPGSYRILRQKFPEGKWHEIATFNTVGGADELARYKWKDFSVEHGETYTYAIQQCSITEPRIFSELIKTEPIIVSFEHIFLSDGERQLRIMFNPQVSSLKETILEQKTDTIGSKFPFFARNGHVRYKEIPLSGLISYWMDSDQYFGISAEDLGLPLQEVGRQSTKLMPAYRTNLDDINFRAERQFKLKVLEWLNNGKPKLFRSPAEGNYVLRLMNISLSPNAQVGRMLHNFSATGYEVANAAIEELKGNNVFLVQQMFPGDDHLEGVDDYFRTIKSYQIKSIEITEPYDEYIFSEHNCKLIKYLSVFYKGGPISFFNEEDDEYVLNSEQHNKYEEFIQVDELNNGGYSCSFGLMSGASNSGVIVNAWVEMLPEEGS